MIKCIIIDDLRNMIEIVEDHVKANEDLDLIGTFENPLVAIEFVKNNAVDIVFLDVEMPKLNGLDFIARVKTFNLKKSPSFILTTGFQNYAVESYEYEVIDFIVKPVTFKRFSSAIEKYCKLKSIVLKSTNTEPVDFLFVENKEKTKKIKVMFQDIIYIESDGNYISLYTEEEKIMIYNSLNNIQEMLDPNLFLRVYRSFIISLNKVESIQNGQLVMKTKSQKKIPIGDFYRAKVLKRLNVL